MYIFLNVNYILFLLNFKLLLNFLDSSSKTNSNMFHTNPSSCRIIVSCYHTDGRMNRHAYDATFRCPDPSLDVNET